MFRSINLLTLLFVVVLLVPGAVSVYAQADDEDSLIPGRRKENPPQGIQESLQKMRIEKDKKDFNEMLRRGDDAAKLAEQLKDSGDPQQDQLVGIGKLIKKVREELGAEGPIDTKDEVMPESRTDAVKALKEATTGLAEELKRCTRFTVSAAAINRANEVLRLVRFLHG
jgi:hypothetical protein